MALDFEGAQQGAPICILDRGYVWAICLLHVPFDVMPFGMRRGPPAAAHQVLFIKGALCACARVLD